MCQADPSKTDQTAHISLQVPNLSNSADTQKHEASTTHAAQPHATMPLIKSARQKPLNSNPTQQPATPQHHQ
jgi:hypothetical protein